jgi:hypothetical protein
MSSSAYPRLLPEPHDRERVDLSDLPAIADEELARQTARLEGVFRQAGHEHKRAWSTRDPVIEFSRRLHRPDGDNSLAHREWELGEDFFSGPGSLVFWLASQPFFHPRAVARAIASPRSLVWRRHADGSTAREPILLSILDLQNNTPDLGALNALLSGLKKVGEWSVAKPFVLEAGDGVNADGSVDRWEAGRWPSLVQISIRSAGFGGAARLLQEHASDEISGGTWGDLALASIPSRSLSEFWRSGAGELDATSQADLLRLMAFQEAGEIDAIARQSAQESRAARQAADPAQAPRVALFEPDPRPLAERAGIFASTESFLLDIRELSAYSGNAQLSIAILKILDRKQATVDEAWAWLSETAAPTNLSNDDFKGATLAAGLVRFIVSSCVGEFRRLWGMLGQAERFDPLAPLGERARSLIDEALIVAHDNEVAADLAPIWAERIPAELVPLRWASMARVLWANKRESADPECNPGERLARLLDAQVEKAALARSCETSAEPVGDALGLSGLPSRPARRM